MRRAPRVARRALHPRPLHRGDRGPHGVHGRLRGEMDAARHPARARPQRAVLSAGDVGEDHRDRLGSGGPLHAVREGEDGGVEGGAEGRVGEDGRVV